MKYGLSNARFTIALVVVGRALSYSMRMISEMLGHSTIQLTADTYTHLMAESKRELAEKMDVIT